MNTPATKIKLFSLDLLVHVNYYVYLFFYFWVRYFRSNFYEAECCFSSFFTIWKSLKTTIIVHDGRLNCFVVLSRLVELLWWDEERLFWLRDWHYRSAHHFVGNKQDEFPQRHFAYWQQYCKFCSKFSILRWSWTCGKAYFIGGIHNPRLRSCSRC